MNQVTKLENTNEPVGLLAVIQKAVTDPNTNVENLERLYELYEKDQKRQSEQAYAQAMAECQAEMPMIVRDAENDQTNSRYSKHEAICKAIKPIYTKHGFSLDFSEGKADKEDEIRTVCEISHKQGYSKTRYIDLPTDMTGIKGSVNKTRIHGKGSTFSYGRRYLTLMIFDLATYDDNDANIVERISEEQVNTIHSKITDNGLTLQAFLNWAKVKKVEDISVNAYELVINEIDRVIKLRTKK